MRDRLLLDTSSLMYRAFFALPTSITDPQDRPVNALRGFMDMLATMQTARRPEQVIAVFDAAYLPDFRVEAFPDYKHGGVEDPEELAPQFGWLEEVLDAAGIVRCWAPELEADDALATLVQNVAEDERHLIVTGDRDLLALVRDPNVAVLFTVKGVKQLREFDEAEVHFTYGVVPGQYAEFATLRGDPSDGLPGVAGIGPQRAAALLNSYGSIDAIYEHLDELTPGQRSSFQNARDYLETMEIVVPMVRDARLETTEAHEPDVERLSQIAAERGLGGSMARFLDAFVP